MPKFYNSASMQQVIQNYVSSARLAMQNNDVALKNELQSSLPILDNFHGLGAAKLVTNKCNQELGCQFYVMPKYVTRWVIKLRCESINGEAYIMTFDQNWRPDMPLLGNITTTTVNALHCISQAQAMKVISYFRNIKFLSSEITMTPETVEIIESPPLLMQDEQLKFKVAQLGL